MTNTLRIVLLIGIFLYFLIVIRLLKQKRLILKYSLLWLLMGIVFAILVFLVGLLGIVDAMNGLFTCAIGFLMILVMALTSIVSKQGERIKELAQNIALLEKRIRDLENKQD